LSGSGVRLSRTWFDRFGWELLTIAVGVLAVRTAVHTVAGLEWPVDPDHFRDIAAAQTAYDGHPLSDPYYAGEWIWYNPLLPWLIAAGAALTRFTVWEFHVAAGPWVNLAAPVAFYFVGARLINRPAAAVATILFLYWTGMEPVWAAATYSPWIFVNGAAQTLFYLTMAVAADSISRLSTRRAFILGLLAGATFLAHSAPAIVAGVVLASVMVHESRKGRVGARQILILAVVAVVVASPFLASIAGRYRFQIVNPVPLVWHYPPITSDLGQLASLQIWWIVGLSIAGLVQVCRTPATRLIVIPWLATTLFFIVYGAVQFRVPALPTIVPSFHFWFYLRALEWLLAGTGVCLLISQASRGHPRLVPAIGCLAVITLTVTRWPTYRLRPDFVRSAFFRAAQSEPGIGDKVPAQDDRARSRGSRDVWRRATDRRTRRTQDRGCQFGFFQPVCAPRTSSTRSR
jgi:hypothetical protein